MKIDYAVILDFLKKHKIGVFFTVAGLIAGPAGLIAGFVTGCFAELIAGRILIEQSYKRLMADGGKADDGKEPFAGAIYTCALAVYSFGDAESAAREAQLVFGKKYSADWSSFCRSASESVGLNGDLIVEYLASVLLKEMQSGNKVPLADIFTLLQISEFNWNETRGVKPSIYLAQLLDYTCVNDELISAYKILGLEKGASVADVKKAHRKLAAIYHPDTGSKASENEFIRIQKAYETIMNER